MSRWIKSVGSILEKLDDRVETAAEDASNILVDADGVPVTSMKGFANRFIGQQQQQQQRGSSDNGSYYEDEDEYYEEYDVEDEEYYDEVEFEQQDVAVIEPSLSGDMQLPKAEAIEQDALAVTEPENSDLYLAEKTAGIKDSQGEKSPATFESTSNKKTAVAPNEKETILQESPNKAPPKLDEILGVTEKNEKLETAPEPRTTSAPLSTPPPAPPSAERRIPSAPRSQASAASAMGRSNRSAFANPELQKAQHEVQRLTKQNSALKAQLEAAEAELSAQNKELDQAAQRMAEDRQLADEEREDLIDEHEEALRNLQISYEARLEDQRQKFEEHLENLNHQLATEAQMRAKEGGDMTVELGEALERERKAIQKADQLEIERSKLEQTNSKLLTQEEALREDIKRLTEVSQTAAERERQAEERLDAANKAHQRALSNRQAREAELERTIAELGVALANKESTSGGSGSAVANSALNSVYQRKYEMAVEELESTKSQLSISNQSCEALQKELQMISRERTEEALAVQEKEREHDQQVEQLTSKISRLEASLREYKAINGDDAMSTGTPGLASAPSSGSSFTATQSNAKVRHLTRDLDKSRRQIASLSDQLLRQQNLTESAKSEALVLRGRLQSATARAEAAEQQVAMGSSSSSGKMMELESGVVSAYGGVRRRRVKMGGLPQGRGARTIRSALGLRPAAESDNLSGQLAQTIDAFDLWVLETGTILKHEPLARLALLLYMLLVHLWCFGLVFFHAVESEHGDLGTLTSRRAVLDVSQHQLSSPP